MITCEQCKETGKGSYTTFEYQGKLLTLCRECRFGKSPRNTKSDKEVFDSLQVPFWKLMGQKPKPKDIAYEKLLKSRGMTYGDAVRERNYKAQEKSAFSKLQHELNK